MSHCFTSGLFGNFRCFFLKKTKNKLYARCAQSNLNLLYQQFLNQINLSMLTYLKILVHF